MESSRVYWITVCLLAFTQAVVPRIAKDGAAASDGDAITSDGSPAVQYLNRLFQKYNNTDSNRWFRNGEMNLLPDETKGFANTVHCFRAQNINFPQAKGVANQEVNRRTLQFDFSNIKPSLNILATQLVLLVPETTLNYVISLYEVKQNGELMGPLDSKLTAAVKGWLEFAIHYIGEDTSHDHSERAFSVEVTDQNGTEFPSGRDPSSLLDSITPLLVVYAYDNSSFGKLPGENQEPDLEFQAVQKRDTSSILEERANEPCQVYRTFLTYKQIGWPSEVVISPQVGLHFAYCYGRCNSPFSSESEYVRHAQLLEALNNLYRRKNLPPPVVPPPCCVPVKLTPMDLITQAADGHIVGQVFEDVARCGCV